MGIKVKAKSDDISSISPSGVYTSYSPKTQTIYVRKDKHAVIRNISENVTQDFYKSPSGKMTIGPKVSHEQKYFKKQSIVPTLIHTTKHSIDSLIKKAKKKKGFIT